MRVKLNVFIRPPPRPHCFPIKILLDNWRGSHSGKGRLTLGYDIPNGTPFPVKSRN